MSDVKDNVEQNAADENRSTQPADPQRSLFQRLIWASAGVGGGQKKALSPEQVEKEKAKAAEAAMVEEEATQQRLKDEYGADVSYTGISPNFGVVASERYPELKSPPIQTSNYDKVRKITKELQAAVLKYDVALATAGKVGFERVLDGGKAYLCNPDITVQILLEGKHKDIISAVETAIKKTPDYAQKIAAFDANAELKKAGPPGYEGTPRVEINEQLLAENAIALHDQAYNGLTPKSDGERIPVMLDTDVVLKFFGKAADAKAQALGMELFNSLLENPRVSAIIIPGFIANVEAGGVIKDYQAGVQTISRIIKGHEHGGASYYPVLQNVLKRAICRHEENGEVKYLKDSSTPEQDIIPKIIVWDSSKGHDLAKKYPELNGIRHGEAEIEPIITDATFPSQKIVVLTTNYNYAHDYANKHETKGKQVCRMNLNQYVQELLGKGDSEVEKWKKLSNFSGIRKNPTPLQLKHEVFEHIVAKVDEDLDKNSKSKSQLPYVRIPVSDNPTLAKELVHGVPKVSTSADSVQKNGKPKGKSNGHTSAPGGSK